MVEFVSGWNGKVISTQWVFSAWSLSFFFFPILIVIIGDHADVFDGTMIVLAMYTLNLFHPGNYLQEDIPSQTSSEGIIMEDQHKPATYHQDKAV